MEESIDTMAKSLLEDVFSDPPVMDNKPERLIGLSGAVEFVKTEIAKLRNCPEHTPSHLERLDILDGVLGVLGGLNDQGFFDKDSALSEILGYMGFYFQEYDGGTLDEQCELDEIVEILGSTADVILRTVF